MSGTISQYFTGTDYLLSLPMVLLTLFALGILLIDLMLPREWKWANAVAAFVGVLFATAGVWRIQSVYAQSGRSLTSQTAFMNPMLVDRFAIYFFYLFLASTAIAILMSVRYLEIEQEHHGEFYALMLFSVVGMMCMAAGFDVVLIFIGLELMAISTYVLVGFLRTDRRSNEAALKYLLLGAFSSGIFAYGLSLFYGLSGSTNLQVIGTYLRRQMMARTSDGKLAAQAMEKASPAINATFWPSKVIPSTIASTEIAIVAIRATLSCSASDAVPWRTTLVQTSWHNVATPESVRPATTASMVANATAQMKPKKASPPTARASRGAAILPPPPAFVTASGPTSTMAPKPMMNTIRWKKPISPVA